MESQQHKLKMRQIEIQKKALEKRKADLKAAKAKTIDDIQQKRVEELDIVKEEYSLKIDDAQDKTYDENDREHDNESRKEAIAKLRLEMHDNEDKINEKYDKLEESAKNSFKDKLDQVRKQFEDKLQQIGNATANVRRKAGDAVHSIINASEETEDDKLVNESEDKKEEDKPVLVTVKLNYDEDRYKEHIESTVKDINEKYEDDKKATLMKMKDSSTKEQDQITVTGTEPMIKQLKEDLSTDIEVVDDTKDDDKDNDVNKDDSEAKVDESIVSDLNDDENIQINESSDAEFNKTYKGKKVTLQDGHTWIAQEARAGKTFVTPEAGGEDVQMTTKEFISKFNNFVEESIVDESTTASISALKKKYDDAKKEEVEAYKVMQAATAGLTPRSKAFKDAASIYSAAESKLDKAEQDYIKASGLTKKDYSRKNESNETQDMNTQVNESIINSDDDFKEYAEVILKKAHGDKYDQAIADKSINGLLDKYKDNYGAMIGALTSGLNESIEYEEIAEVCESLNTELQGVSIDGVIYVSINGEPNGYVAKDAFEVAKAYNEMTKDSPAKAFAWLRKAATHEFGGKNGQPVPNSIDWVNMKASQDAENGTDVNESKLVRMVLKDDIEDKLYDKHKAFFENKSIVDDWSGDEFMAKDVIKALDYLAKHKLSVEIVNESTNEFTATDPNYELLNKFIVGNEMPNHKTMTLIAKELDKPFTETKMIVESYIADGGIMVNESADYKELSDVEAKNLMRFFSKHAPALANNADIKKKIHKGAKIPTNWSYSMLTEVSISNARSELSSLQLAYDKCVMYASISSTEDGEVVIGIRIESATHMHKSIEEEFDYLFNADCSSFNIVNSSMNESVQHVNESKSTEFVNESVEYRTLSKVEAANLLKFLSEHGALLATQNELKKKIVEGFRIPTRYYYDQLFTKWDGNGGNTNFAYGLGFKDLYMNVGIGATDKDNVFINVEINCDGRVSGKIKETIRYEFNEDCSKFQMGKY